MQEKKNLWYSPIPTHMCTINCIFVYLLLLFDYYYYCWLYGYWKMCKIQDGCSLEEGNALYIYCKVHDSWWSPTFKRFKWKNKRCGLLQNNKLYHKILLKKKLNFFSVDIVCFFNFLCSNLTKFSNHRLAIFVFPNTYALSILTIIYFSSTNSIHSFQKWFFSFLFLRMKRHCSFPLKYFSSYCYLRLANNQKRLLICYML